MKKKKLICVSNNMENVNIFPGALITIITFNINSFFSMSIKTEFLGDTRVKMKRLPDGD